MSRIFLFLVCISLPVLCFAQKTEVKKVYYANSKTLKLEYEVLKKKKNVRHGFYKSFYKTGVLNEEGQYERGKKKGIWHFFNEKGVLNRITEFQKGRPLTNKKVGIWEKTYENGQVITRYDYDKNEKLDAIIKIPINYPRKAIEQNEEGRVVVKIELDEFCEIEELRIVNSVGSYCDAEALKVLNRFIEFTKKYDNQNCIDFPKEYALKFTLQLLVNSKPSLD